MELLKLRREVELGAKRLVVITSEPGDPLTGTSYGGVASTLSLAEGAVVSEMARRLVSIRSSCSAGERVCAMP